MKYHDIAAQDVYKRQSVTSVIQGLEKHGLVERRSVSTDARQKELVLTEEGVRVQRQVIERIEEMEKRVNGWLSPEEREWWLRCVNKIETCLLYTSGPAPLSGTIKNEDQPQRQLLSWEQEYRTRRRQ